MIFSLPFYEYAPNFRGFRGELDYSIFDNLDILILEINSLNNTASSEKIINYLNTKNVKIIKTFLIKLPIYPLNWSGFGENKTDYLNWEGLDNINYKEKFKKCIESIRKSNIKSDLSMELTEFILNNFNNQLWKYILQNIDINNYKYDLNPYFFGNMNYVNIWDKPFTSKMVKDLDIQFRDIVINDQFYINRYNKFKSAF